MPNPQEDAASSKPANPNPEAVERPLRIEQILEALPPFVGKLSDLEIDTSLTPFTDEAGIDNFIKDYLPRDLVSKHIRNGDEYAPRAYTNKIYESVPNSAPGRAVVEARLIQVLMLNRLNNEISRAKEELDQLKKTPGIQPSDERIQAKEEELGDLYDDLSRWNERLDTIKKAHASYVEKNSPGAKVNEAIEEEEPVRVAKKTARVTTHDKPQQLQEETKQLYREPRLIEATAKAFESISLDQPGSAEFTASPNDIKKGYKKTRPNLQSNIPLIRDKKNAPENLPEDQQEELQAELLQDAEKEKQLNEVMGTMEPALAELNQFERQKNKLRAKLANDRESLVNELAQDPSRIENPEWRAQAESGKAALEQAEQRIQQCDDQLAALENLDEQSEAAAIEQHGSVDNAREHYKNEKNEALQKQQRAKEQLYPAVYKSVAGMFDNSETTLAIKAEIEAIKPQQRTLQQQFKEQQAIKADAIRAQRKDHRYVVGEEVKDSLEEGKKLAPGEKPKGAMKASAREENNPGTKLKLAEEELRRNIDQAPYQLYQNNVAMAAQEFKMRPEIIEDDDKRAKVTGLKQQVADVNEVIAHCDEEIAKLNKVGARLRSLVHGNNDDRKELKALYAKQKEAALEQLSSLEEQLDVAAHDAVSVSMKQGMLNEIKPPAPPNPAVSANQAPAQNQPIQPATAKNGLPPPPNYPAPPPPGQEMTKQPKARINAKAKDAGDGMPQNQENGNLILEPEAKVDNAGQNGQNLAEGKAPHKTSVGEALHRSHSMPNLGGPQAAIHQPEEQQPKNASTKDKSLRASGTWQSAKPSTPKPTSPKPAILK